MSKSISETVDAPAFGNLSPEEAHVLQQNFDLVDANGVRLFVDTKKESALKPGEQRVYPHTDEGEELLRVARRVVAERDGEKFDRVIDCFSGGGNSILPQLQAGIAGRGFAIDLNSRAMGLGASNAKLNQLEDRAVFMVEDVNNIGEALLSSDESTLYIANPPFALTTREQGEWDYDGLPGNAEDEGMMREGGRDGLKLTRAYVTQTLNKAYTERALEHAKVGDTIIGVAYSRIGIDGRVELEKELHGIAGDRASFTVELVEGAPLWRGPNGKKEQPNPMPLTSMRVKGVTADQQQEYDHAAANHLAEGYDRLGYYRYIIRVGNVEGVQGEMMDNSRELLN